MLVMASSIALLSCNKDEQDEQGEPGGEVVQMLPVRSKGDPISLLENESGILTKTSGLWRIVVSVEGTYDEQIHYFLLDSPFEMPPSGTRVLFSGEVYELDDQFSRQIPKVGGCTYYAVKLTNINAQKDAPIIGSWTLVSQSQGFGGTTEYQTGDIIFNFHAENILIVQNYIGKPENGILSNGRHTYSFDEGNTKLTIDQISFNCKMEAKTMCLDADESLDGSVYIFNKINKTL